MLVAETCSKFFPPTSASPTYDNIRAHTKGEMKKWLNMKMSHTQTHTHKQNRNTRRNVKWTIYPCICLSICEQWIRNDHNKLETIRVHLIVNIFCLVVSIQPSAGDLLACSLIRALKFFISKIIKSEEKVNKENGRRAKTHWNHSIHSRLFGFCTGMFFAFVCAIIRAQAIWKQWSEHNDDDNNVSAEVSRAK